YENGVHTIAWSVTDDAGNTDGIGSRYFTIRNNSQSATRTAHSVPSGAPDISQIPVDYSHPVKVKRGYNQEIEPHFFYPDDSGNITITIKELERLEIRQFSTGVLDGFYVIGNRFGTLPPGSTLDGEKGIFSWQPGPAFIGDYQFVFIEKTRTGKVKQKLITIRIRPGF
ncbi:MAG: hypothetical protein JSV88_14975, partial [Candidatus Aminicenantes bacterium]